MIKYKIFYIKNKEGEFVLFSLYHTFKGSLNDTNVNELIKQLDYSIETYEDRLKLVKSILGDDFFIEYFDDYFKSSLSSSDALSDKNNVCLLIEKITDYLLCSEEVNREFRDKKVVYKFYQKEDTFKQSLHKDIYIEDVIKKANSNEQGEEIIHFLMNVKNNKKPKKIVVKESDYSDGKDTYLANVLRDYSKGKNYLTKLRDDDEFRTSQDYVITKGKASHMLKEINSDMLHCKIELSGVFGQTLKHPLPEGQVVDWCKDLDYKNPKHIKALLYSNSVVISPDNEISYLVADLENTIKILLKKGILNQRDLIIISMIRQGFKQEEIAEELNISQARVNNRINQIANNISKEFSKQEVKNTY